MKRYICMLLALSILLACMSGALAETGNAAAVIGADLTESQISQIYTYFGIEEGTVPEFTMTNEVERQYLSGIVEETSIGTRSVSCVYIEFLKEGCGLDIQTYNVTLLPEVFRSSLETAGIRDAKIIVAAPFPVSGTAGLAGIFWAYDRINGEALGEAERQASAQEFTVTEDLAHSVGMEDAQIIIDGLKELAEDEKTPEADADVSAEIVRIAGEHGVTLSTGQVNTLLTLFKSIKDLDDGQIMDTVRSVENTINKVNETKGKIEEIVDFLKNIVEKISEFVKKVSDFLGG